jgi:FSR family fosmidomycin resistance protein-like MFS transporter
VAVALVLLVLAAPAVNAPYPSTVALGQSFIPRHLGMASGLIYGVAVGIGGCVSPFMGIVGDTYGLNCVFGIAAVLAAVGGFVAIYLYRSTKEAKLA